MNSKYNNEMDRKLSEQVATISDCIGLFLKHDLKNDTENVDVLKFNNAFVRKFEKRMYDEGIFKSPEDKMKVEEFTILLNFYQMMHESQKLYELDKAGKIFKPSEQFIEFWIAEFMDKSPVELLEIYGRYFISKVYYEITEYIRFMNMISMYKKFIKDLPFVECYINYTNKTLDDVPIPFFKTNENFKKFSNKIMPIFSCVIEA
jgi:hypothetical protein